MVSQLFAEYTVGFIGENQSKLCLGKNHSEKQKNQQQIQSNDINSETWTLHVTRPY